MTERDLERLKDLAVPAARETAKRAALDAAMDEFETALAAGAPLGVSQAQMEDSPGSAEEIHPQGNIIPLRQTETSKRKRSFLMTLSTRQSQAIAASVAALVIAAPLAFQQMGKVGLPAPTFNNIGTAMKSPERSVAVNATKPAAKPSAEDARRYDGAAGRDETQIAMGEVSKAKPDAAAEPAAAQLTPPTTPPSSNDAWRYEGGKNIVTETKDEAAKHIVPPDLVGKSALGITGQERRLTDPTDGLGAIGSAGPLRPWKTPDDNRPASTPPPAAAAAPSPATTPAEGKVAAVAPRPAAALQMGSDGSARDLGATLDSHSKFTGQAAPARLDAPRLNAELGRRMMERDASNPVPGDPSKPNPYSWMGRVEQEKSIVLEESHDKFDAKEINPVKQVTAEPVSTFSIDVDTASYSFVRRALNAGHLPPKDAVRVEEMINYFPYAYPAPDSAETPFKPTVTVMPSPWNPNNKLVHVAIRGYDLTNAERPRANIVLLMDVSGSMEPEDRLPLVKNAFRMLVDQLKPDDTVGIVTYASGSGIALEPTKVADKWKILAAIDRLGAGGSTAGAAGISDAYRLAEAGFDKSAVNRIILATDGDFNVGITDQNELKSYIERKRQSGIFLSILGVGQGNHNDALMQTLAQNGNGTAA